MNANGRTAFETIEGAVEAVNERGVRIGEDWYNRSQFHPVELPESGAHVRLKVDSRGYIKELETMSQPSTTPAVLSDKDARITRLAVLKAAATFGASRPDLKSSEILMIADKWIQWVNQTGRDD
jgi:hypothetical protein